MGRGLGTTVLLVVKHLILGQEFPTSSAGGVSRNSSSEVVILIPDRAPVGYTSSLLPGNGLTRTLQGMGRMVDLRGWWWLSELAVGVQVRGAASRIRSLLHCGALALVLAMPPRSGRSSRPVAALGT